MLMCIYNMLNINNIPFIDQFQHALLNTPKLDKLSYEQKERERKILKYVNNWSLKHFIFNMSVGKPLNAEFYTLKIPPAKK